MEELFYKDGEPIFSTELEKLKKDQDDKKRAELKRWQSDFRQTFCDTPHGKRVLWFLIHESYIFRKITQYNANAYGLLGKQALGQDIIDIIGPEKLLDSLIEVRNQKLRKEQEKDGKK